MIKNTALAAAALGLITTGVTVVALAAPANADSVTYFCKGASGNYRTYSPGEYCESTNAGRWGLVTKVEIQTHSSTVGKMCLNVKWRDTQGTATHADDVVWWSGLKCTSTKTDYVSAGNGTDANNIDYVKVTNEAGHQLKAWARYRTP